MGVTIHYRGRLGEPARIEDFEDRLIDFALAIGGTARIWRTWADDNPERMVRGVILDLAPGHESTSMLVSPEGWLIGLTDIKDAEDDQLAEPPWCIVKTQFGSVEGHVTIVEMLVALKREFLPDLEVSDEGGYWERRDLAELVRNRANTRTAIDGLAEGLRRYGLSREAAEDPEILIRHVERVAAHVHRILGRPSEHPPLASEDQDEWPEHEAAWKGAGYQDKQNHRLESDPEERHPLLQHAMELHTRFDALFRDVSPRFACSISTLYRGAGEASDGLARAISHRDDDIVDHGLCVVQLKRALRGAAFARGALFPLRSAITEEQFDELFTQLKQVETGILSELAKVRMM